MLCVVIIVCTSCHVLCPTLRFKCFRCQNYIQTREIYMFVQAEVLRLRGQLSQLASNQASHQPASSFIYPTNSGLASIGIPRKPTFGTPQYGGTTIGPTNSKPNNSAAYAPVRGLWVGVPRAGKMQSAPPSENQTPFGIYGGGGWAVAELQDRDRRLVSSSGSRVHLKSSFLYG
jgi:hypothetical protein